MFCVNRDASLVAQWMFCCNYMADILLGRLPRNLRSLQSLYGRAAVAVVSVNGLWIGVCIVWFNSNLLWAVFLCLTTLMCSGVGKKFLYTVQLLACMNSGFIRNDSSSPEAGEGGTVYLHSRLYSKFLVQPYPC